MSGDIRSSNSLERNTPSTISNSSEPNGINRIWGFNSSAGHHEIVAVEGSFEYLADKGVLNSGCLKVMGETKLKINIPIQNLPVLLSYKIKPLPPPKGKKLKKVRWESLWEPTVSKCDVLNFSYLENRPIQPNVWRRNITYFKENITEYWSSSLRGEIMFTNRKFPGHCFLRVNVDCLIDDITFWSVSASKCPDTTALEREIQKIPPEKQKGTIPLHGVKSFYPGKPVFIRFDQDDKPGGKINNSTGN